MCSNSRLMLILLHFLFFSLCDSKILSKKEKRLFALLGYLHGYKIGYDEGFKLGPIVPIIVLPTISQQQTVSILKTIKDNYQSLENGNDAQATLATANATDNEYEDIKVKETAKRDSPETGDDTEAVQETEDTVRQANTPSNNNAETSKNTSSETSTSQVTNITETSTKVNAIDKGNMSIIANSTDSPADGYPTAMYNNEFVTTLQLTTAADKDTKLPPIDDNRWQNFTNMNGLQENDIQNTTSTERVGPYAAAYYDNSLINSLLLTTEVYDKDTFLPPAQDERWKNFTSDVLYENSGQFKPLAGLYYDGFLHRPLKKVGFVPRQNYLF